MRATSLAGLCNTTVIRSLPPASDRVAEAVRTTCFISLRGWRLSGSVVPERQ